MNQLPMEPNGRLLVVVAAGLAPRRFKTQKVIGAIKVSFGNGAADPIRAVQPASKIYQFAAFRAERAKGIRRGGVQRLRLSADGTTRRMGHE